jgi:hypothetical protein
LSSHPQLAGCDAFNHQRYNFIVKSGVCCRDMHPMYMISCIRSVFSDFGHPLQRPTKSILRKSLLAQQSGQVLEHLTLGAHLTFNDCQEMTMHSVAGIFASWAAAEPAVREMLEKGIPLQSLIFLTPEQVQPPVDRVPTTDTEAHGMGKAMGAFVGGVVGASAGAGLGSAVASLVVPGVGPILAAGIGAASLLGLGGAVAGEKIGERSENALDQGVPRDDVLLYRELLKRRRTVVIANLPADDLAETAWVVMQQNGAQDVDEARREVRKAA